MAEAVIKSQMAEISEKYSKGDFAAIATMFTGDAKIMYEKQPMMGKGDVVAHFTKIKAEVSAISFTTEDVIDKGDVAVERGSYTMTLAAGGQENGRYVNAWIEGPEGGPTGLIKFQITNSS